MKAYSSRDSARIAKNYFLTVQRYCFFLESTNFSDFFDCYSSLFRTLAPRIVLANRKATLTVVFLCRLSGAVFLFVLFGNIFVHNGIVGYETPMPICLFPPIRELCYASVCTDIETWMKLAYFCSYIFV